MSDGPRPEGRFAPTRLDGIRRLRLQHWTMVAVVAVAIALMWRLRDSGTLSGLPVGVAVAVGCAWAALSLTAVFLMRRRPLHGDSPHELAQSYNIRFILETVLALSNLLVGFVVLFTSGSFWPVVAPGISALVGLVVAAPVDADLDRRQTELREAGIDVDLATALREFRPGDAG